MEVTSQTNRHKATTHTHVANEYVGNIWLCVQVWLTASSQWHVTAFRVQHNNNQHACMPNSFRSYINECLSRSDTQLRQQSWSLLWRPPKSKPNAYTATSCLLHSSDMCVHIGSRLMALFMRRRLRRRRGSIVLTSLTLAFCGLGLGIMCRLSLAWVTDIIRYYNM